MLKRLKRNPSHWLVCILGWGVFTHGTPPNTTTEGVTSSIIPYESFTVVDLHPVRGQTFRELLNAEIIRARQRGLNPFLEIGGSSCGVCNALHKRLNARPFTPQVRAAFNGTGIIRIAIEEWPDVLTTLRLVPDQRIPVYVAFDTAGRITRLLSVDYWTLRSLDTDTLNSVRQFFRG